MIDWCRTTKAVLDSATLSTIIGQPVRATRLRIKPGFSTVAALQPTDDGPVEPASRGDSRLIGWVHVCAPGHHDKTRSEVQRASERGLRLNCRVWSHDNELLITWGPPEFDPRLHRGLDPLRDSLPGAEMLRYNPLRRMVLREPGNGNVLRITSNRHRARTASLAVALADHGVPTLTPLPEEPGDRGRISRWPYFGMSDLVGRTGGAAVAERTATALARLHAVPLEAIDISIGALADLPVLDEPTLRVRLDRAATLIVTVLPGLATVMSDLVGRVAQRCSRDLARTDYRGELSVCHGDFSADQILVGHDEVQIIDLDRACVAPAALDLGSLRATGPLHLSASVEQAYRDVIAKTGAQAPRTVGDVAGWSAYAMVLRLVEPLRDGGGDVEARVRRRVAACLEVLSAWTVPEVVREDATLLTVLRAWPAGHREVTVEGRDADGRLRAGRLRLSPLAADGAAEDAVTLLPYGIDPKLPALSTALAEGGELRAHRAGKRAVLRGPDGYLKATRSGRAPNLVDQSHRGAQLATMAGLASPTVLWHTGDAFFSSVLAGTPVHELGRTATDSAWRALWRRWRDAWQHWQTAGPLEEAQQHDGAAEAQVVLDWAQRARRHRVLRLDQRLLDRTVSELGQSYARPLVPAHRDLHDKQLIDDGQRLGILDLDTVAMAEPALDLANLAVHARLRVLQRYWEPGRAVTVLDAVEQVGIARAVEVCRLRAYAAGTWLRLAGVYAFRPRWNALAATLADPAERSLMTDSRGAHYERGWWSI